MRFALPILLAALSTSAIAQQTAPPDGQDDPVNLFGFTFHQSERYKFGGDLAAGRVLATLWQHEPQPLALPEAVVVVPLHTGRLRQRGYNQALELAKPLARAFDVALHVDVLRRVRPTQAQTELDARARRRNVRGAFALASDVTLPAHVAVLDDVMTTGATLAECARVLKRAGVQTVDVWALARAPTPGG